MPFDASLPEMPPARPPAQGERKIVTVLFADVVGSTTLAENLDPEEWGEIIGGLHARVNECVTRYEGLVAQLLGDGALAFFGAPGAHEDDPERAVRAALDLMAATAIYEADLRRSNLVQRFQVRVGLNTGLVVVGNVGAGAHVEYLAVGDTVNLAARMQSSAEPGTVLMAENTARAVGHAFDLAALGEVEVKGKAEPVAVYRALGPKAQRGSRRGIAGLDSPIVGREREIALLSGRLHDLAAGKGGIIAIIAEAGLGKSRLVAEVVKRSPEAFARVEGRCVSFGASTPYAPIIELLSQALGWQAADGGDSLTAQLRSMLPAPVVPLLATLLGLPLEGEDRDAIRFMEKMESGKLRERMIEAIVMTFEHLARRQPLALILEDLHWADRSTLDVLDRLLPATERAPLAVIAVFRPGAHEPSWEWHAAAGRDHVARYTPILLGPLPEAAARTLVANLLHIEDLPEPVRELILARAEGNPFYVEEVIRVLLDAQLVVREGDHWRAAREIANIALPDSLAGVIMARLDRLDAGAKAVAQTAAVLGRDFSSTLLARLVAPDIALPAALDQLVERELIQARATGSYRFKHVLTQEAAYNALLLSKRRALHHRAAEALALLDTSQPGTIASHFLNAQEPLAALPYLIAAGERALAAYSTPEALALFKQACAIAQGADDVDAARRAFEGLGSALSLAADPAAALANYEAMESYALAHRADPMRVSALNKTAFVQSMWLGQFEPAETYLNRARDLAQACNDRAGLAESLVTRCNVSTARAEFEEAVKHLGQLVQVGRELNRGFETAFGLVHTANTWTYLARFDRAWPAAVEARDFAEEQGDLLHLAHTLTLPLPWCQLSFGDLDAAHAAASRGVEMSARVGESIGLTQGRYTLATIARLRGEYQEALAHLQDGLAAAQQFGLPFIIAMMLGAICGTRAEFEPDSLEETLDLHKQTLDLLDHPVGALGGGVAWADMGECALQAGELEMARGLFEKGLSVHTPFMYLQRPRFLVDLARLDLQARQVEAAQQRVREARAYVDERRMAWQQPLVALAEADVKVALGQGAAALDCYRAALAQAESMGMAPLARRSRQGLDQAIARQAGRPA